MSYCLYLRKSRADLEAEAHGEGETLARHERILMELARRGNYDVTQIYREIVSGETIAARPVMQQLLSEVEQGAWDGVLVVEVERLARGDTIDQGIMAQTFKYSGTKIITPTKVYDPENEFDEEYFEFGLFMSRREYKTINRRLRQGHISSAKEGKYVATTACYGYRRVRVQNGKGWTLEVIPDQADIVRLIFDLYVNGEKLPDGSSRPAGTVRIASILRDMGVLSPRGLPTWNSATISCILTNPVYIGKVRWLQKHRKRIVVDGVVCVVDLPSPLEEQILVDGLHEPIVDKQLFDAACGRLLNRGGPAPVPRKHVLQDCLAGLVVCDVCGRKFSRTTNKKYVSYRCSSRNCSNISCKYDVLVTRVLDALSEWVSGYELSFQEDPGASSSASLKTKQAALRRAKQEAGTLAGQLSRTHDLLEQGIYDTDTFLDRSRELSSRISSNDALIASLESDIALLRRQEADRRNLIPRAKKLLAVFDDLPSAKEKNDMLKEVLEKIVYRREVGGKGVPPDNFEIVLYPRLPPSE